MSGSIKKVHQCKLNLKDDIDIIEGPKKKGVWPAFKRKWKCWVLLSITHSLCSKYFKSETAVMEEKIRQLKSKHPYIIHPLSKFRMWYETYLFFLYGIALFLNPIEASFTTTTLRQQPLAFYQLQTAIDILCLFDVVVNFFTGCTVKGSKIIEMRPKQIARNYLVGFFFFDFISSIPRHLPYMFCFIVPLPPRPLIGLLNICRLFKAPRLLTLMQIMKLVAENTLHLKSNTKVRIVITTLLIVFLFHIAVCFQLIVPSIFFCFSENFPYKSLWIFNYDIYKLSHFYIYIFASFRGIAYFIGVGFKNLHRLILVADYIPTILTYFAGKIFMAIFWIVLSSEILQSRMMDIRFYEVISQLNEYMSQKQLPQTLKDRLLQYYTFKFQKKYLKEELVTSLLSENLRKEISIHVCKTFIANVTLFSELTPDQINRIVRKLVSEIFLPSDIIIQSGTEGNSMYFINSGTVGVFSHSGKEIAHLTDGAYFGEIALVLKGQMRVTTVIAIEPTQVFKLDKKDFNKILLKNKAILKNIVSCAEKRMKEANDIEETYKKLLFEKEHTIKKKGHT